MRRTLGVLAVLLALVPASAGAGATRPALALTATPAHVALAGSARATVRIANPGSRALVVDVARAGFSLDMRGRPRVAPRRGARAAAQWLAVGPARFVLSPGSSRLVSIASRVPRRAEPGDHDALVLLTTRPARGAGVAVRVRIGVVVVVRAPGRVVRRIGLLRLHVRRLRHARVLELVLANRGNVTESLPRGAIRVVLRGRDSRLTLRSAPRQLRPHTRAVLRFRAPGRLHGPVTARVAVSASRGRPVLSRNFWLQL